MTGRAALAAHELRVFLVASERIEPAALAASHLGWLAPDERARYERYVPAQARHEFLVTRVLCRKVLAELLGEAPESLAFDVGAYGKPALRVGGREGETLAFNLSNTNGLVACAVARSRALPGGRALEIGVDVENMDRKTETLSVADRFFSRSEVDALFALPSHAQQRRFFELWTLKEAYIKARGLGLAIPLGSFSFSLELPGAPRIGFDATLEDDPEAWWFEQAFPSSTHALALAVRRSVRTPMRTSIVWTELLP